MSICAAAATANNRRQNASQALRIFTSPQTTSTHTNTHNNINKNWNTRVITLYSFSGTWRKFSSGWKVWWRVDAHRATTDVSSVRARTGDWARRPASTRFTRGGKLHYTILHKTWIIFHASFAIFEFALSGLLKTCIEVTGRELNNCIRHCTSYETVDVLYANKKNLSNNT